MLPIRPEKILAMIEKMAARHKGEMHRIVVDWEIVKVSHPKFEGKTELVLPLMVIDFIV